MADQDFEQLLAIIKQLNSQLEMVKGNMAKFQESFLKTGSQEFIKALNNQRIEAQKLGQELLKAQQAYEKLKQSQSTGPNTHIPHPPGTPSP